MTGPKRQFRPDNPPVYLTAALSYRRRARKRAAQRRLARHNQVVQTALALVCFFLLAAVIRQASVKGLLSSGWNLSGVRDAMTAPVARADAPVPAGPDYIPDSDAALPDESELIPLRVSADDTLPDGAELLTPDHTASGKSDDTAADESDVHPALLNPYLNDPAVWLAKHDAGELLTPEDIYTPSPLTPGSIWYQGEWIPIYQEADALKLEPSDFSWQGDRLTYGGGIYDVAFGVDVSAHQNQDRSDRSNGRTDAIDWDAARDDGVSFAIIRVGMRGYSEGSLNPDPYAGQNIDGAKAAGLLTGAYFFSQAVTIEEALEEAELTLMCLREHPVDGPVCYDWEIYDKSYRTYGLSPQTATACAAAFCARVAMEGYTPMIYTDREISYRKYDQGVVSAFMSWYPQYPSKRAAHPCPNYYYHVDIWQFSKRCTVAGIGKNLDGNLWFRPTTVELPET